MNGELLKQLYSKYQGEIYLYLYSLCGNPDVAEDLTQDAFLKALLSLEESHGNMRAWLYMVARNLYFNYRKREQSVIPWEEAQLCQDLAHSEPLSRLTQTEEREQLLQAMNRLSGSKREILQMQYFGGLSQKEIAAILKLTPANVRVVALRARRELKQYLEGYDHEIS